MVLLTDLSEVLITGINGLEYRVADRYYREPEAKIEFAVRFRRRLYELNGQFQELLRGRMTEDEYWQQFLASGDWPLTLEEIKAAFGENLRDIVPGTLQLYQRITQYPDLPGRPESCFIHGTPDIYLVSDHISERKAELEAAHPDVFQLFTDAYWSCDMAALKSDAVLFPWLLRDLCIDPCEALFIDDMHVNVETAARAGIPSVHFRNVCQLEATLRDVYGFQFAPVSHLSPPETQPPVPLT